jgi:DNA-binding NarL/FixJ family response regulator
MNIIVIDDDLHFRDFLKFHIENNLGHKVILTCKYDDISNTGYISDATILLMSVGLTELNKFNLVKKILWQYPHLNVLAIFSKLEDIMLKPYLEAGFKGFILRSDIERNLKVAINKLYMGEYYIPYCNVCIE